MKLLLSVLASLVVLHMAYSLPTEYHEHKFQRKLDQSLQQQMMSQKIQASSQKASRDHMKKRVEEVRGKLEQLKTHDHTVVEKLRKIQKHTNNDKASAQSQM